MSFREKSIVATIAALLTAAAVYLVIVVPLALAEGVVEVQYQPVMIGAVGVLIVVIIAGHIVAAATRPREVEGTPDERDRLIEWRGESVAGYVLASGVFVALSLSMAQVHWFWIANVLAGMWVLSDVSAGLWKLALYRRGT